MPVAALERVTPVCPGCGFEPECPVKHGWPPATKPGVYAHLCEVFGVTVEAVTPDIGALTKPYEIACLSCGASYRAVFYRTQA